MKILLVAVNAKYIHTNLAIYSLKSYSKKYQENIKLMEYTINQYAEDILRGIYKENADVIAFSCYIWNFSIITQVIRELKKVQPEVIIWFGGPEVTYDVLQCLEQNPELDGVMIGEGEQTFLELMEYYVDDKGDLSGVNGIVFKTTASKGIVQDDEITITNNRQPLQLDLIPFPYQNMEDFNNKIIYYESSRGCPFSCSYCLSSIEHKVRLRDTELVKSELMYFINHNVTQVKFVDRTFNCNKKHAMGIWQFIKENDNGVTNFHFEISADLLTQDELNLLATLRPGQVQFEIGVQSTNPQTVEAIHRNMDFSRLVSNVKQIREGNNIHQHLDLIAGLPYEDFKTFSKSFNDVYALSPDQLQLGFLKILKGSRMEQDSKEYGIVPISTPPYEVLFTKWLKYTEILQIKGICEMVEVYYNSGQFYYSIKFLEHFYRTPFDLYVALSNYYEIKQMDERAHSRIRRYEILLDFCNDEVIKRINGDKQSITSVFEELLVFDAFLREDLKSRPKFAKAPMEYKKERAYCDEVKLNRKNTHVERFEFDVIESSKTGHAIKAERIILFDYSNKDPLTKAAQIIISTLI